MDRPLTWPHGPLLSFFLQALQKYRMIPVWGHFPTRLLLQARYLSSFPQEPLCSLLVDSVLLVVDSRGLMGLSCGLPVDSVVSTRGLLFPLGGVFLLDAAQGGGPYIKKKQTTKNPQLDSPPFHHGWQTMAKEIIIGVCASAMVSLH